MLWTIAQTADFLHVSVSWVRRHQINLPIVAMPGRLISIDSERLQSTMAVGKSLKSERVTTVIPRRYQQGTLVWKNTKHGKVCYGMYRVDIQTASGIHRQQKKIRLGTRKEFPTDSQARKYLIDIISGDESGPPVPENKTYGELAKCWQESEGPTQTKPTADRYAQVLRWLLPFWKEKHLIHHSQ
jgi:hypothetical protein